MLHMSGAPPHLDMFDYKPELVKNNDKPCPDSLLKGKRFAFTTGVPKLLGTPQHFAQRGKCGAWVSDALPGIASIADDLTFVKSMYTDQFNHAPAELLLYTGSARQGRPSMGSWVTYGLGSESRDLPGFERGEKCLGQRLFAISLSRRPVPIGRRSGALCHRSGRHGSKHAPAEPRCDARSE